MFFFHLSLHFDNLDWSNKNNDGKKIQLINVKMFLKILIIIISEKQRTARPSWLIGKASGKICPFFFLVLKIVTSWPSSLRDGQYFGCLTKWTTLALEIDTCLDVIHCLTFFLSSQCSFCKHWAAFKWSKHISVF